MMSNNFKSSSDLYYIDGSYKAIGNNGNCYNSYVSNTSCTGEFSQNLRQALFNFSDHLPVVMEIEAKENTLSTVNIENNIHIIGSNLVKDELRLNLEDVATDKIEIYNQLGQLVLEKTIQNQTDIQLKISTLPNGLYFLKTSKKLKPLKFIKI